MNTSILEMLIHSNKDSFSRKSTAIGDKKQGKILVDLQMVDVFMISVVMKISSAAADALNCNLVVASAMRADGNLVKLIKSYAPLQVMNAGCFIVYGFLSNITRVINVAMNTNTGEDLVSLKIQDMPVGMHIYDLILARMGLSSIKEISLKQRFCIAVEVSFFYAMWAYINKNNISYAVLPDNAYRQGLIFEILRKKRIPSISGIDVNGISMHKYESAEDYLQHCRTPDIDVIKRIINTPSLYSNAKNYLLHRTSGLEQQHDVIRAYSKDKSKINRQNLINTHGLCSDKKIVLVMAHIFRDAPHAYPGMLFNDYEDWLIKTCLRLAKNPHVNFLIKEHPSAELYNEKGRIDSMLNQHGFGNKLLAKDINTASFFNSVDVVVTCGGTAGMEFPCHGVPVLVAAKPPYSSFPYIISPNTETAYFSELDRIHEYGKLSEDMMKMAEAVLYVIHSLMKVEKYKMGLGSQQYLMGGCFDMDLFMKEMISDCNDGVGYSSMISIMERFLHGKHKNLIDYSMVATNT